MKTLLLREHCGCSTSGLDEGWLPCVPRRQSWGHGHNRPTDDLASICFHSVSRSLRTTLSVILISHKQRSLKRENTLLLKLMKWLMKYDKQKCQWGKKGRSNQTTIGMNYLPRCLEETCIKEKQVNCEQLVLSSCLDQPWLFVGPQSSRWGPTPQLMVFGNGGLSGAIRVR